MLIISFKRIYFKVMHCCVCIIKVIYCKGQHGRCLLELQKIKSTQEDYQLSDCNSILRQRELIGWHIFIICQSRFSKFIIYLTTPKNGELPQPVLDKIKKLTSEHGIFVWEEHIHLCKGYTYCTLCGAATTNQSDSKSLNVRLIIL